MKAIEKEKLWEEYQKNPTPKLREQLIIEYAQLVRLVAGRLSMYLGHNVEYDDLVSYGIFGLIDAIDKFNLEKMSSLRHMQALESVEPYLIRSGNGLDSKNSQTKAKENRRGNKEH